MYYAYLTTVPLADRSSSDLILLTLMPWTHYQALRSTICKESEQSFLDLYNKTNEGLGSPFVDDENGAILYGLDLRLSYKQSDLHLFLALSPNANSETRRCMELFRAPSQATLPVFIERYWLAPDNAPLIGSKLIRLTPDAQRGEALSQFLTRLRVPQYQPPRPLTTQQFDRLATRLWQSHKRTQQTTQAPEARPAESIDHGIVQSADISYSNNGRWQGITRA